jgi:NADH-quinone oxidoreductase subunit C
VSEVASALQQRLGAAVVEVVEDYGVVTVEVAAESWCAALAAAASAGATFFDFLTAYDELEHGFAVIAHVSTPDARDHLMVRTRVPRDEPVLESATQVFRGAGWHERETHEMFGISFSGNDNLDPLLLPPGFSGTPMRKDFVLASRVAKAWPGEKEPGEPTSAAPARRRARALGVPLDWAREPTDADTDAESSPR